MLPCKREAAKHTEKQGKLKNAETLREIKELREKNIHKAKPGEGIKSSLSYRSS